MTIDRTTLRWNGWGPVRQENPLPGDAPQWHWIEETLGLSRLPSTPAVALHDIRLPQGRLSNETLTKLRGIVGDNQLRTDDYERAFHARGKSYHDLLYVRAGKLDMAPDAVVYPRSADEVLAVVQLCAEQDIALIPFGGGSSVVGGINAMAKSLGGAAHQPCGNSRRDGASLRCAGDLFLPDFFSDEHGRVESEAAARLSENEGLRQRALPDADRA